MSFESGRPVAWGESPPGDAAGVPAPRGRRAIGRPAAAPDSPFDPGPARLVEALGVVPGLAFKPKDVDPWIAWLPTAAGRPLASSPIVAEGPSNGATFAPSPWGVSAVPLDPARALDLLAAALAGPTLAPGVVVGKALEYWAGALRFAGALVARQQFLPGIERVGDRLRAAWQPVVVGPDAAARALLAKAMPHACRALGRDPSTPPTIPAVTALDAFLAVMVDQLVRSTVATDDSTRKPKSFDSVHDRWLHALRSADGVLGGDPAELERLSGQVRDWRRPIAVAAAAPFRLCFRLEEPEADADPWHVRYLLQAADEPSLLVPAEDAWAPRGPRAAILGRGGFRPREYLLATLGQAAGLCPRIEASLKAAAPGGYDLDNPGAFEFLDRRAWLLEQAGFGVLLPAWWSRKGTKLRLAARAVVKAPKLTSKSGLSLDQLLRFRWEIALGDQTLTLRELRALAKLKTPLVKVRGQWVQLSAEEIQAALDFWKTKGDESIAARRVVHMALGAVDAKPPGGLAFEGVRAEGWIGELLAQLQGGAGFEALTVPEGFRGSLRPYQGRGYSWLGFLRRWGFGACLADDMGLGKTVQTLTLLQHDWEATAPRSRRPTLLICPMSVVGNWQKEAARFTPELPVMVHHGLGRARGAEFKKQAKTHALVLSSFALLHRDFDALKAIPWDGVILDEAQNIKNPQTKQAQSARALKADYRVALTGTPVENHVGDLWSIMEFLNPGLLGSQAEFKRSFHVPIQVNRDPDAARRLQRLTAPFILRRLKTDKSIIADLPDKLEMKVFCTLTKEQVSLYEAVVDETARELEEAEGIQRKGLVLATLSKLKQVCNHPAHFLGDNSPIPGRSGKLARLTEMLEEALSAGDKALVFSQFSEMGLLLQRHLQETFGRAVPFLHGGVPKSKRDTMVESFQKGNGDGPRIFLLTVKAGGTGLNLTAANHVFHFDRWWNPAVENQATDRAFRIGQSKSVQVHKFVCVGTLEEKIDDMIENKKAVAGMVVGSGEDWLTKLSTAELKELFALRREALGE
ncbi:MAG TPA: DEAD/DEAH box helicase [Isosphaeraceae bacterium]|nr:DEAD/DEAH box helicase [Isosphaeraceae bacterium]